jgi:tetratricopeptide (TPR) repeat protein
MKIPKIGKEDHDKFVELDVVEEVQAETSPAEIDAKRAAHSLERASQLAERGDFAGAILATRQAIALNHGSVYAHGLLGQFLERSGDFKNAAVSYSKALELAPNSTLDKVSLERVQERLRENVSTGSFSFNESELSDFSGETSFFDRAISNDSEVTNAIDAKLPPTRAELEALSAAPIVGTTEAGSPIVSESFTGITTNEAQVSEESLPVAAALPPTTAVSGGIEASLPPTSAGVISDTLSARLSASPETHTPKAAPLTPNAALTDIFDPISAQASTRREDRDNQAPPLGKVPAPFVFQPVFDDPKVPVWTQFLRQPSFFGRTLPLVVLAVFSLGFLAWARERAVARSASTPTVVADNFVPTDPVLENRNPVQPQGVVTQPSQANPVPNSSTTDAGVSISNRPMQPAPSGANPTPAANVSNPSVASNPAPAANARPARPDNARPTAATPPRGRAPEFPAASIAPLRPADIIAERDRQRNRSNNNGNISLPRPQINQDEPAEPPVRVAPIGPDPSSAGPPLNPAGSSNNGYIRIRSGTLGAVSAPQRPQNQANNNEQTATTAARTGQTDQAIQGLTSAINNNPSDSGFRFQQRASLFLERGDYSRAVDDFQSAISAYQDQINRGENVTSARSGLRSARSGLNLALSRRNAN